MEKKALIGIGGAVVAAVIIIVVVVAVMVMPLMAPVLKVSGAGVTAEKNLSLMDLQSATYTQVTNQEYDKVTKGGAQPAEKYTGVSVESLLDNGAFLVADTTGMSVSFVASDGYSRSIDLADLEGTGAKVILAWGGDSFDAESDGKLKLVVDLGAIPGTDEVNSHMWVRDIVEITIA